MSKKNQNILDKTIYLKDYKVPNYKVKKTDIEFCIYDEFTLVSSEVFYYKNVDSKEQNTLELHGEELELVNIYLNDRELKDGEYTLNNEGTLVIQNVPQEFCLKVLVRIYPHTNTALDGLYVSGGIFCTQCEPQGFRRITYYLDRPDVMSEFTTKIIADKTKFPILLSNGNQINKGTLGDNRHFVQWHDPFPKPSYLFAMVAGKLEYIEESYQTFSGRNVVLRIFTESHNISKCGYAMESLKKAMKWDEDTFGLEYDLDLFMLVAVDDFNAGAMENKGLNIFNSKLVFASPESATDNDYLYIERVVAHEYFHNRTGNRVTCRDWFQLSLKEGLTVFRDAEFMGDMYSKDVKRIEDVQYLRTHQFQEDAGPMAHPIRPASFEEIRNFYTITVYEKGSEVIRIYQEILGKKGFRKGMDLYFKKYDGQAVTTEDFLSAMSEANDIDLSQMQNWYEQAGTPKVEVVSHYDEETKKYILEFTQSCPKTPESDHKKPFLIPIKFGLIQDDGIEIVLENDLIILREYQQSIVFDNIPKNVTPSLLRRWSAPIHLHYDYTYDDYSFLMKYDTDSFARFEAGKNFMKCILIHNIHNGTQDIPSSFLSSFGSLLNDEKLEHSLKAEMIMLPSEIELAGLIGNNIDPEGIHKAHYHFSKVLGNEYKNILEKIYHDLNKPKEYRLHKNDIGERKLKNICLEYLSYSNSAVLAFEQYKTSNNMTDKFAALCCLSHIEGTERQQALDSFYSEWKHDENVIDKWFTVQATSHLNNTVQTVSMLCGHKLFDMKKPNKVRALLNAFSTSLGFHKEDGSGYKLIADKVIELDNINPNISSRLAKSLIHWKSLKPNLGEKLKAQLVRISEVKGISGDVSEVVKKSLI